MCVFLSLRHTALAVCPFILLIGGIFNEAKKNESITPCNGDRRRVVRAKGGVKHVFSIKKIKLVF